VRAGAEAEAVADAIDAAEVRAREAVSDLTLLIYLEPDIDRGQAAATPPGHQAAVEAPAR